MTKLFNYLRYKMENNLIFGDGNDISRISTIVYSVYTTFKHISMVEISRTMKG